MKPILGAVVSLVAICATAGPALAAKPRVSVGNVTVSEGAGTAEVPVALSKKAKKKVKFSFQTEDREALAGFDYTATSGSLKIPPRKRSATISVPLNGDTRDEFEEVLDLRLTSARRAKIGGGPATLTIVDDDSPPSIAVTTDSIPEGPLGSFGARELEVTLSAVSSKPVEFTWSAGAGSATADEDFQAAGSTSAVAPGERTHTFTVFVLDDATDEFDETIEITLSDVQDATPAEASHSVTIADDDPAPAVSLATTSVAEGTEGTFVRPVGVQLSAASAKPIEVDYATANGTATAPGDFTATSGGLAFAPGQTAQAFNLTTVGDYTDENPDESLTVGFSNPVNVSTPGSTQSLTITDDDPACVSADSPPGVNLGSIAGDSGTPSIEEVDQISPCGDTDWYQLTLNEISDSTKDLTAVITLDLVPNGSPSGGDLDVCGRISATTTDVCSTNSGSASERIEICIDDPMLGGSNNTTTFLVEVEGFGNAVNDYTLRMFGNVAVTAGGNLGNC